MSTAAQIIVAVGILALLVGIAVVVVVYARHIRVTVGSIQAEFKPNGGHSIKDILDRLERRLDPLVAQLDDHEDRITALEKPKPRTPRKKAA